VERAGGFTNVWRLPDPTESRHIVRPCWQPWGDGYDRIVTTLAL